MPSSNRMPYMAMKQWYWRPCGICLAWMLVHNTRARTCSPRCSRAWTELAETEHAWRTKMTNTYMVPIQKYADRLRILRLAKRINIRKNMDALQPARWGPTL